MGRTGPLLLIAALLAAPLAGPRPALAAKFTGAYLLQLCDRDAKEREKIRGGHAACQSYISGVLDYHSVLQSLDVAPKIDICVPDGTPLNRLHDIVLAYLRRNGQHDGFVAAPAVTMALYETFPCKKQVRRRKGS